VCVRGNPVGVVLFPRAFLDRLLATHGRLTSAAGAMGQLGSELIGVLRGQYGAESIIATDIRIPRNDHALSEGELVSRQHILP
jgi:hypothetical protein